MGRLSHVQFIRMIASRGTLNRIYEGLRLNEAADEMQKLEAQRADLIHALNLALKFINNHLQAVDVTDGEAQDLMSALQAALAPIEPAPTTAVELVITDRNYDPDTGRILLGTGSIIERHTEPLEDILGDGTGTNPDPRTVDADPPRAEQET